MFQPFITDFIKNRSFQFIFVMGLVSDIALAGTIKHIIFLFGFPYLSSVGLYCLMNRKKQLLKQESVSNTGQSRKKFADEFLRFS